MSRKFKIGDTLICISKPIGSNHLTEGKLYKVIHIKYDIYPLIMNDFKETNYYCPSRFKLSTRKQKLERILCQDGK